MKEEKKKKNQNICIFLPNVTKVKIKNKQKQVSLVLIDEVESKRQRSRPRPEFLRTDTLKAKDMNGQGMRTQFFQIMVSKFSIIFERKSAYDIAFC